MKIPLYGELATDKRVRARHYVRFKDACKRYMRAMGMNIERWEDGSIDHSYWIRAINRELELGRKKRRFAAGKSSAKKTKRQKEKN